MGFGNETVAEARRVVRGVQVAQAVSEGDRVAQVFPPANAADLGAAPQEKFGNVDIQYLGLSRRGMTEKLLFGYRLLSFYYESDSKSHSASSLASLSQAAERHLSGRSSIYDVFSTFEGFQSTYYDKIPPAERKEYVQRLGKAGEAGFDRIYNALVAHQTTFEAKTYAPSQDTIVNNTIQITAPMAFDAGYVYAFDKNKATTVNLRLNGEPIRVDLQLLEQLKKNDPEKYKQLLGVAKTAVESVFTQGKAVPPGNAFNVGKIAGLFKLAGEELQLAQAVLPNGVQHAQMGQDALGTLDALAAQFKDRQAQAQGVGVKAG